MSDRRDHVSGTEARAGATPHMARWVLIWGLLLTVVAFTIIYLIWM